MCSVAAFTRSNSPLERSAFASVINGNVFFSCFMSTLGQRQKQMPHLMNLKVKGGSKFARSLIPVDRSASCDINNASRALI